jgi:hypothetical protein
MMNLGFCSTVFKIFRQLVGLLGRELSPSQGSYLHRTTQTQKKRTETSMFRVGLEPTTPVFERQKTLHASDCANTVLGRLIVLVN